MKTHTRFIERAITLAGTSEYRWQLGAVVVNNGNVIGWGINSFRNSPTVDYLNATTHAEMAAIRGRLLSIKGCNHLCGQG